MKFEVGDKILLKKSSPDDLVGHEHFLGQILTVSRVREAVSGGLDVFTEESGDSWWWHTYEIEGKIVGNRLVV